MNRAAPTSKHIIPSRDLLAVPLAGDPQAILGAKPTKMGRPLLKLPKRREAVYL